MQYTVAQLARLAGVSSRTLRFYDQKGLLCPVRGENGYRRYGPAEVDRLQQILFYRRAGLELEQIGAVLDDAAFDPRAAMQTHLETLKKRRDELDALITTAEKTLQSLKGEMEMKDKEKFEGFKRRLMEENEEKYGAEIREKYGEDTVNASNAKMMNMSEEQYAEFEQVGRELNEALAAAVAEGGPAGEKARQAAQLHKRWLGFTWGEYSPEAHRGLVQMYVDDERFAAYYEAIAPGAAAFLRDAVNSWLDEK